MVKNQSKQFNLLNGLFSKKEKDQIPKLPSKEVPDVQNYSKNNGVPKKQEKMGERLGTNMYSTGLKAHKQLLEKYIQDSQKYFQDLDEYKKAYIQLKGNLKDFNQLSQTIADKKQEYSLEMAKYEEVKASYEQNLKEYQELTEKYEKVTDEKDTAHKEFTEQALALKKINEEVQSLIDKKSEKNETFVELKDKLVKEQEVFKAAQSHLDGIVSVYELLKKNYEEKKEVFEEARKKYHHANTIKSDWETLIKDFEKTKANKAKFEKNLISIQEKIKNTEENAKSSKEIYSFVEPSLESLTENFKEHKKAYEETAIAYKKSKETYDTEYEKYSELQSNLEQMNSLSNPSQTVIGYITRDLEVAKNKVDDLAKDFNPLKEKYDLQKSIFEQISQSYKLVKNLVDEKKAKSVISEDSLSKTLEAQKKITMVLEVLKSKYNLLNHQRGQSEEHFRVISQEYEKIETEFQKEQESYSTLKEDYVAFENRYNSTKESYESAKDKLAQTEENIKTVEKAYSEVAGLLRVAKANKESILADFKKSEEALESLTKKKDELDSKVENDFFELDEIYQRGDELYLQLAKQAEGWQGEYSQYSKSYKEVLPEYLKVSEQLDKLNQKYEVIFNEYKALEKSSDTVINQYQQEMQKFNSEQEFYNRVSLEFNRCTELRNNALKKQNEFEVALQNLKGFIFKNNLLTFPIGEATGYNFIDEFNIPEISVDEQNVSLKNRAEFSQWVENYQKLYSILNNVSKELTQALVSYQKQISTFIQVGGKRVTSLGNSEIAYRGTVIESYLEQLSNNFNTWQAEYFKREQAFSLVVKDYKQYLEESIKLNTNIEKMSDSKNGLQEIVNAINSLPNYMDVYSADYRDVQLLADTLGTDVSELTHLRNADELKEIVHKVYFERIQSLIDANLDNTINHFQEIRSSYDQSIANLRKQLDAMEKATGIPTRKIVIESSLPKDLNLKTYFKDALDENVNLLLSTITGSSSLINSVKKISQFKRVKNLLSVNEGGNEIILPESPLHFNEKELEFSLVIASVKNIEAPNKVEKIESTYSKPDKPEGLIEKPSYIEDISKAEKIEKQHQKIDKKEALKALA